MAIKEEEPIAIIQVAQERLNQDRKWGEQNHDPLTWLAILMEEVGEFSHDYLHHKFPGKEEHAMDLHNELVQVAAVALAMVECSLRNDWPGAKESTGSVISGSLGGKPAS